MNRRVSVAGFSFQHKAGAPLRIHLNQCSIDSVGLHGIENPAAERVVSQPGQIVGLMTQPGQPHCNIELRAGYCCRKIRNAFQRPFFL